MSVFIYRSVVLSFRDQASLSLGMSDIAERSTSDGAAFFETICQRVGEDTSYDGWDPCIPGVSISMGVSGQRTFQETALALALNLVSLIPIIGALIPRINGNIQGLIILGLGGVFVTVWAGDVYFITRGSPSLPLSYVSHSP